MFNSFPRSAWERKTGRSRGTANRKTATSIYSRATAAALSGLWMTHFYPLSPHLQGDLLYWFRVLIGSFMVVSIALSLAAILQRDVAQHRAWIMRGYAIAQGAGTQAVISILWLVLLGAPNDLVRDLLLIAGWIINLAVAEWIIRTSASKQIRRPLKSQRIPMSPLN